MKIFPIECGNFMVDGGAMFGVIPKAIWQKRYPCNDKNLCNIATRSLLIDSGEKRILIDTGIGTRIPVDFLKHQNLNGNENLVQSLAKFGYSTTDITDVLFTHLHWDHCGGALINDSNGKPSVQFPNAKMWVSKRQWEWAINPNIREIAAYPSDVVLPLNEFNKLNLIDDNCQLFPNVEVRHHRGHTDGLLIPVITYGSKKIVFAGDLIPVSANLSPIYLSAYDIFPFDAIKEKENILHEVVKENYIVVFQHDLLIEACTVEHTERGYRIKDTYRISEL